MKEGIVRLQLHVSGLVVLGLLASSPVFAAIAFITDDTGTQGRAKFYERDDFSFAVKPAFTIPTGDEGKDLGNGKITYCLYFIASKEMNPLAFHLKLDYIRNNNTGVDRKDIWHASLASTVDVMKNLKLAGDIGVETNFGNSSNTPPACLLGGAIYSLAENFDIGLGLKAGLTKPETDVAVGGGITYRL
ncbi:MAG: transporter [Acidobacteriota bacterium]